MARSVITYVRLHAELRDATELTEPVLTVKEIYMDRGVLVPDIVTIAITVLAVMTLDYANAVNQGGTAVNALNGAPKTVLPIVIVYLENAYLVGKGFLVTNAKLDAPLTVIKHFVTKTLGTVYLAIPDTTLTIVRWNAPPVVIKLVACLQTENAINVNMALLESNANVKVDVLRRDVTQLLVFAMIARRVSSKLTAIKLVQ